MRRRVSCKGVWFVGSRGRESLGIIVVKKRNRQLNLAEVIETAEGVQICAQWAPAIGLFRQNKSRGKRREQRCFKAFT